MDLICDERRSDSPYIQRIWRSRSNSAGEFISMAASTWEIVVSRYQGSVKLTVRGPETKATPAFCPADVEFFGIHFTPGTLMPQLPPKILMDRQDVNLPEAGSKTFWLNGSAWQFPDFDNAETFVDWLARDDLLLHDPLVGAVLEGEPLEMSLRTVQRRFLQATGLTYGTVHQIKRARFATGLLRQRIPILDVVEQAGYADQPHLTRSLKHLVGQTPAQLLDPEKSQRLSFLYKT